MLADASPWWFLLAVAIMMLTVIPMAERWRRLLASQGMRERLPWLTRAYFVSYTAGQILPTVDRRRRGADRRDVAPASRTARRISAIVLLERALGGAATVLLGAVGFLLAIGRYDVGAYLWIEGAFVLGTILLAFLFFARSARPLLRLSAPLLARAAARAAGARRSTTASTPSATAPACSSGSSLFTVAIQAVRVLAIWATARAVGIDLSPRIYYVMGPLFFLVLLVPFTLNGFAVREAFFVSFLGERRRRRRRRRSRPASSSSSSPSRWRCPAARSCSGRGCAAGRLRAMPDASAVVVTYNALPWIEQCLDSVRGEETVVVDNGSSDGTRRRRPRALSRRAGDRAGEPGPRRRLERGHGGRVGPLLPDPERGRVADRGRARAPRCGTPTTHPEAASSGRGC